MVLGALGGGVGGGGLPEGATGWGEAWGLGSSTKPGWEGGEGGNKAPKGRSVSLLPCQEQLS